MTAKHPLPSGIDDEIDRKLAKVRRDQITARSKVQREMDGALPHDPVNRPSHYLLPGGLEVRDIQAWMVDTCLLYTSPSPRDQRGSRMAAYA